MAFKYLEHEADVGILATGKTLEEAFEEGAKAMFGVMADLGRVKQKKKVSVSASSDKTDTLFIEWLNSLLSQKDIKGMMFSRFKVKINKAGKDGGLKLTGEAWGDATSEEQCLKTEVKAATYSGLRYTKTVGKHSLQCVLDI